MRKTQLKLVTLFSLLNISGHELDISGQELNIIGQEVARREWRVYKIAVVECGNRRTLLAAFVEQFPLLLYCPRSVCLC